MDTAYILDMDGNYITQGLQTASVSDEAWQMASRIAREQREGVILVDSDGNWLISPDGTAEVIEDDEWIHYGLTPPGEDDEWILTPPGEYDDY